MNKNVLICYFQQKLKNVESSETDPTAQGLKLESEDYLIGTGKVLGASILLNKDTDLNESLTDVSNLII